MVKRKCREKCEINGWGDVILGKEVRESLSEEVRYKLRLVIRGNREG